MGGLEPPICLPIKMQNKEKPRFSISETVFCTGIDSKNDLEHISKRLFRGGGGANLSKIKLINQKKKIKTLLKIITHN